MPLPPDFAVFILTHARPTHVDTFKTLRRCGYTGPIYLVLDDQDDTLEQYRALYGQQVITFDKAAAIGATDTGDNSQEYRSVIYARNAAFALAQSLGLSYFLELDDDYSSFDYRFDDHLDAVLIPVRNLDAIFAAVLAFYAAIPAAAVTFMQGGDFIGGKLSSHATEVTAFRKAMNTFFLSPARPFQFMGKFNDDVSTYTRLGLSGTLFLSLNQVSITQHPTQHQSGGLTDIYLQSGTYVKSFYTVMYAPSCTRIIQINPVHKRIHHMIRWANAAPCILPESTRKLSSNAGDNRHG